MSLSKPNQHLKDAAFALESAALQILHKALGREDAEFLQAMKSVEMLRELAGRLTGYGEETKVGRVTRTKE